MVGLLLLLPGVGVCRVCPSFFWLSLISGQHHEALPAVNRLCGVCRRHPDQRGQGRPHVPQPDQLGDGGRLGRDGLRLRGRASARHAVSTEGAESPGRRRARPYPGRERGSSPARSIAAERSRARRPLPAPRGR